MEHTPGRANFFLFPKHCGYPQTILWSAPPLQFLLAIPQNLSPNPTYSSTLFPVMKSLEKPGNTKHF